MAGGLQWTTFFGAVADSGRFLCRLAILHQRLQVSLVHLVQEVDGGLLVLVGAVNEDGYFSPYKYFHLEYYAY